MNEKPINIEYNVFHGKIIYLLDGKQIKADMGIEEVLNFVLYNDISSFKIIQYDGSVHDGMKMYKEIRKIFG